MNLERSDKLFCRYFFAEVFDFFRNFFLITFHANILFMILPLAIRLYHRPCFLAFVYMAISSILKSYPSVSSLYLSLIIYLHSWINLDSFLCTSSDQVGDSALYLGLLALFANELAGNLLEFFLF